MFDPGNRLIVALDVPSRKDSDVLLERHMEVTQWVKIGLELFCNEGPDIVYRYALDGYRIMLDLKLHDIPQTVSRTMDKLAGLYRVELITVHASGGRAMMEAAVKAAGKTKILAVTVLTSLDKQDLEETGSIRSVQDVVLKRAWLAFGAGCAGVVASPHEVAAIRAIAPPNALIVTPGIRFAGTPSGDQKRVMTPRQAREAGADLIVVGRTLHDAPNPDEMARQIVKDLNY